MKTFSLLLSCFFLLLTTSAFGQRKASDRIYVDANVGLLIFENSLSGQLQAGLGYRFNERHGLGLSYHRESGGNVYNYAGIQGFGVDYRYSSAWGFITKVGFGKITDGWAGEDTSRQFEFRGGKMFTDLSFAYHLRIGITLGLYLTQSPELKFATYLPAYEFPPYDYDNDELVFDGVSARSFTSAGITVGLALPLRKRRKKRE